MLKNRFQKLLDLTGRSQAELAQDLNIHSSYVSKILSGAQQRISRKLGREVVRVYGCDYDWIMSGAGRPPEKLLAASGAEPRQEVSQGASGLKVLALSELAQLPPPERPGGDLALNVGRAAGVAVRAEGDSMSPTIPDGAVVGVDPGDREPVDNRIFLLRFPAGVAIRRLRFRADGCLVVADNPAVEDELVSGDLLGEGLVLGRVRWIHSEI